MAANPRSHLDPGQIIKDAYDESAQRIRVDANVTAPDGSSILIDATTDSIKVGNSATGPFLNVNPDGSINVVGSFSGSTEVNIHDSDGNTITSIDGAIKVTSLPYNNADCIQTYNEVTAVASGIETTIATYTAPVGVTAYLQFVEVFGSNIAEYRFYKNIPVINKKYTYFSELGSVSDYRTQSDICPGLKLTVGDIVRVTLIHNRPDAGDFNARIQVLEVS